MTSFKYFGNLEWQGLLVILFPFEGHKSKPSICTIRIMASISAFQADGVGSIPTTCSIARIGPAHSTPRMDPTSSRTSERVGNLKGHGCKTPLPKRWLVARTPRGKSDKTRWAGENTLENTSLRVQIILRLTSLMIQ